MKERIISGVILAAAIIGLDLIGSYPLSLALMLCSIIGYCELTAVLCSPVSSKKKKGTEPAGKFPDMIAFPGLLLTIVYYVGLIYIEWRYGLVNPQGMISASDFWTLFVLALAFLLTLMIYVFTFPRRRSSHAAGAVTAFLYVPVMLSFLLRTRNLPHGIWLYLLIFICSSVSDVCALAVGMAIGRHFEPGTNLVIPFLIIGICGSIIGQTGDLAASAIKRNHQIKDYGHLIPGHGGIMDRFDSVIFTAPVIYFLSFLMMGRF